MSDRSASAVAAADPHHHAGAGADDHPLAHHFDTPEQQHQSALLGMWAFLSTEIMFFGGALTAYTVYRANFPGEFAAASQRLSPALGAFNTVVLLGSSLSIALAVRASQLRDRVQTVRFLILTMILGTAFLGIKAFEWSTEFKHGLAPGPNFHFDFSEGHGAHGATPVAAHADGHKGAEGPELPKAPDEMTTTRTAVAPGETAKEGVETLTTPLPLDPMRAQMYFVFYFFLTGLHALHMIIGLAILGILAFLIARRKLPATGERTVEITGLYWHFVDIVWVFLYPLLYLIEVA